MKLDEAIKKALIEALNAHENEYVGDEDHQGYVTLDGSFNLNNVATYVLTKMKEANK